jgi:hypothetical protein
LFPRGLQELSGKFSEVPDDALVQAQALHFRTPAAPLTSFEWLRDYSLSPWERVRVRGVNYLLVLLHPRPLSVGEGAKTKEAVHAAWLSGQN